MAVSPSRPEEKSKNHTVSSFNSLHLQDGNSLTHVRKSYSSWQLVQPSLPIARPSFSHPPFLPVGRWLVTNISLKGKVGVAVGPRRLPYFALWFGNNRTASMRNSLRNGFRNLCIMPKILLADKSM